MRFCTSNVDRDDSLEVLMTSSKTTQALTLKRDNRKLLTSMCRSGIPLHRS